MHRCFIHLRVAFATLISLPMFFSCSSEKPPNTEPLNSGSALPAVVPITGDSSCELPESEWRGYEPKLAAWLAASDAVFVGTIADVVRVNDPVYVLEWDEQAGQDRFLKLPGGRADCPADEFKYAVRYDFENVETLGGTQLPEKFSIQQSQDAAAGGGVRFRGSDDYPTDLAGNPVYYPGARVGAAIFQHATGGFHWAYRQFEVLNDKLHLQDVDEDGLRDCWGVPQLIGIPDEYEGAPFADFAAAIRGASTLLTQEEEAAIEERQFGFRKGLANPLYPLYQEPRCTIDPPAAAEDASVPNDPNAP